MDPVTRLNETIIGDHSDDLRLEDFPSRNVACGEAWWRPRHRKEDG